ncbi:MAG: hypothetical protein ACLGH3_01855 [Actinomycetota bacterium]
MRSLAAVLSALCVLVTNAPASAAEPPLIIQEGPLSSGWLAVTIDSDGSDFSLEVSSTSGIRGPIAGSIDLYDENLDRIGGSSMSGTPDRELTYIDLALPGFGVYLREDGSDGEEQGPITVEVAVSSPGQTTIVVWWFGQAPWTLRLEAAPGVEILGLTRGDDVFMLSSIDLESAAHLAVFAPYGARVQVDGSITLRPGGRVIVGSFTQAEGSVATLEVDGPGGSRRCPTTLWADADPVGIPVASGCFFHDLVGPDAATGGNYTFRSSGVGAGSFGSTEVTLAAAIIELP